MTEWQFIGSVAADAIGAAIAAIGFSVISNPPRRVIPCTAILAAIGHSIRFVLLQYAGLDLASASFIAAFSIGLLSHFSAYKPLLPGHGTLHTGIVTDDTGNVCLSHCIFSYQIPSKQ